jgi:predicted AAA+ superfamily ATPase
LAVVKLRKEDQKILEELKSKVKTVKGETSGSEVLGLSLRFTYSKTDEFLATVIKNLEKESVLDLLRNPSEGEKTDARRVEEYLYR